MRLLTSQERKRLVATLMELQTKERKARGAERSTVKRQIRSVRSELKTDVETRNQGVYVQEEAIW